MSAHQKDRSPFVGIALVLLLGFAVLVPSLDWVGRVFPGFLILDNRVVASAGLSNWPASKSDVFQAEVLTVDGRTFDSAGEIRSYVTQVPAGTPVTYAFEREGERFERTLEVRPFTVSDWALMFGSLLACGFGLAGMGVAIRYLRGSDPTANGAVLFLLIGGVWALTAVDLYGPSVWFRLHAFAECMLFAGAVHMALVFPSPVPWVKNRQWLIKFPYVISLSLAFANQWLLYDADGYRLTHGAAVTGIAAGLATVIGSQIWAWFNSPSFEARQRLKVVVIGTLFALTPQVLLLSASLLTDTQSSENAMAFSGVFYPMSIGYAVLRSDLFQVDAFVRRSLNYVIVTSAIALCYAGLLVAGQSLAGPELTARPAFVILVAMLATGVLPLRHKLQEVVDRLFYRTEYNFRHLVSDASERLAAVTDLEQIRSYVVESVDEALRPSEIVLEIGPWSAQRGNMRTQVPAAVEMLRASDFKDTVEVGGGGLLVPFAVEGRLVAFLQLGRRLSGGFYGGEDRRLLQTLANQGAVALENALALEQLRTLNRTLEVRVAERTTELASAVDELRETQGQLVHQEKMASVGQLVAGVAHEINNPLNFIEGNLHHLEEYSQSLSGAVGELEKLAGSAGRREELAAIREEHDIDFITQDLDSAFAGCREGVDRAMTIVRDLRTFSRLDRGEASEVDVNAFLDTTVNLLRSRLADIEVVREYSELPTVHCLEGQISQVFMNLVVNAADAMEGGGRITIRTRNEPSGCVTIEVEDDGRGIPDELAARIFEPFFTTKEVGKGTGLGLAISYGVLARHGGKLEVDSEEGVGTTFTVVLPVEFSGEADGAAGEVA